MSDWGAILALVLIGAAVIGAISVFAASAVLMTRLYQSGSWLRLRTDAATETAHARTPVGSAEVAMTMHPDIGRCYAIRTKFRGEPEKIVYTLPTMVMVVRRINEMVAANQDRRGIPRRP